MPRVNQGKYKKYHNQFNDLSIRTNEFIARDYASGLNGTISDEIQEGSDLFVEITNFSLILNEMTTSGEKFELEEKREVFIGYIARLQGFIPQIVSQCNHVLRHTGSGELERRWISLMPIYPYLENF